MITVYDDAPEQNKEPEERGTTDAGRLCDGGEKLGRVRKPCRSSHLRIRLPPWSEVSNGGAKGQRGIANHYRLTAFVPKGSRAVLVSRTKKLSANIKNILTNINFRAIIFNVKPKHIFYLEDQSNEKT